MATYEKLTSSQLCDKATALAEKLGIEKKDLRSFIDDKVKEWKQEQKEIEDRERDERALQRQEQKEKEAAIREQEEKAAIRNHELELAKLNSASALPNTNFSTEDQSSLQRCPKFKYFKTQPYDGLSEPVDKFLRAFELQCTALDIAEKDWPSYLIQSLKDKAREAISYMNKDNLNYTDIKTHLLNHFIKTPDHYRMKFHELEIHSTYDPTAFVEDIRHYLKTWLEMCKIDLTNPNEILDMLIVDKVLLMSSDKLFTYLKEKNITRVNDLIKALNNFRDSHPNISMTKVKSNTTFNMMSHHRRNFNRKNSYSPSKNNRSSFHDNRNKSTSPNAGKFRPVNQNRSNKNIPQRKCFICGYTNHTAKDCRKKNTNTQNQGNNHSKHTKPYNKSHENAKQPNKNNFKQASASDYNVCMTDINGKLMLFPGYINNIEVFVLRDTGCTSLITEAQYVKEDQYIDKTTYVTIGDGSKVKCRTAIVSIDTPWISGEMETIVMPKCIAPIIVGNVTNVKPDNSFEIYDNWIKNKSKIVNNLKPTTLDTHSLNNQFDAKPYNSEIQTLNLLIENKIDQGKWLSNLEQINITNKDTIQTDNKTLDHKIKPENNNTQCTKLNNFPHWNGNQAIESYIDSFNYQCDKQNIPSQLKPIILTQHLNGHKKAYKIAEKHLNNYENQILQLKENIKINTKTKSENPITTDCRKDFSNNIQSKQTFCTMLSESEKFPKKFIGINYNIIAQEQKKDLFIANVIANITKINKSQHVQYKMQNDILVRSVITNNNVTKQIVVPKSLINNIMFAGHDNPLSGHLGADKTFHAIYRNFWWKGMRKDIKHYVRFCDICLRKNKLSSTHIAPVQKSDTIVAPFYKIAIDIIGPMTTTKSSQNRFVLMIVDMATRWVEAIPLRDITSERICNSLLSVFTRYGFPSVILSDNGTQFVSQITNAFNRMLEISQVFSARYHPQSNGCIERLNQTIKLMLKKVTVDKPAEWDIYLPMVLFAYRSSIHQSTGFTPFEMLFGKNPKTPLDIFKDTILQEKHVQYSPYEYIEKITKQIDYANEFAKEKIESLNQDTLKNINRNRYLRTLNPNDMVLILLPTGTGNNKEWNGPYKVLKRQTKVSYKILVDNIEKIFHINNLRLYSHDSAENNTPSTEIPVMDEQFNNIILNEELLNTISEEQVDQTLKISLDHITSDEVKMKLKQILEKYSTIISNFPGKTSIIQHKIILNDYKPFRSKVYTVPQMLKSKVEEEINSLLKNGIIRPSTSQFSSPMVLVRKKNGTIRICCDYRKLNLVTELDQEGLPNIEDIVHQLGEGKIFSTIDLTRGFWQIPLAKNSRKFTAFTTHVGFFEWTVMPFGLVNSTATFTKMMRNILKPHPHIQHYVDDICIFTSTYEDHFKALEHLFTILKEYNLTVSPEKIKLCQTQIEFLGHKFTEKGLMTSTNFKDKILHIKTPTTKKQVRSLVGLFTYYNKFIPEFSMIIRPLINLTKKSMPQKIKWTDECQSSLTKLISLFSQEPILTTISACDDVVLATDASKVGLGSCLMKEYITGDGKTILKPAIYLSRALTEAEKNYPIIELECLSIYWSVKKLHRFLLGRRFTILVDHKPLLKFNINNIKNNRINKYAMFLTDYQFTIKSVKGTDNHIPDILSRLSTDIS